MDAFGNCPRALRYCPECSRSTGTLGVIQEDGSNVDSPFPWMKKAQCRSTEWNICTLCTGLRVHMIAPGSVQKHHRLCHKEDQKAPKKRKANAIKKKKQRTIDACTIEEADFSCIPQESPVYKCMSAIPPPTTIPLQPGLSPIVPVMPTTTTTTTTTTSTTTTTTTTTSHPTPSSISHESLEFDNPNSCITTLLRKSKTMEGEDVT
jgi:hypothetical protein